MRFKKQPTISERTLSCGFGKVYMGKIEDGKKVAVKRADPGCKQGLAEFQKRLDCYLNLTTIIVSLIDYSHEGNEMILVYEHMANGSLRKQWTKCGATFLEAKT